MTDNLIKFSAGLTDEEPFIYPNIWDIEKTTGPSRLIIGPRDDHIELMISLAGNWKGMYGILYVLTISHDPFSEGRYQIPQPVSFEEACGILRKYSRFFTTDGRHHIWLASTESASMLVYDHHNVIFAYGDLQEYSNILNNRGFVKAKVAFPSPHRHHYNKGNNLLLEQLLCEYKWKYFPLQEDDDD